MKVWCDTDRCYYEVETVWNGTLARQDDQAHSLLTGTVWHPAGHGWMLRESVLPVQKPESGLYMKIDLKGKSNADIPFAYRKGDEPVDTGTGCICKSCGEWIKGFAGNTCAKCRVKGRIVRPLVLKYNCKCGVAVRQKGTRCEECRKNCRKCGKELPQSALEAGAKSCPHAMPCVRRQKKEAA